MQRYTINPPSPNLLTKNNASAALHAPDAQRFPRFSLRTSSARKTKIWLMRCHTRVVETMYHIVSMLLFYVCLLRRCGTSSLQSGWKFACCTAKCRAYCPCRRCRDAPWCVRRCWAMRQSGRTKVRPYNALPSNALQWPLQKGADYCVKEA